MDDPASKPCVRLTKGVHLVFARTVLPVRESLVLADERGRIVFVMPHDRYVLVGTTDTDFTGDPASVRTEIGDVEYLLAVLAESLPGIKLTNADVATSFAGLRALVREEKEAPSSVPREEVILESLSGLITVAGGKFTTHRAIAQKLVDRVMKGLGRAAGVCPTLMTPFPGARALADGDSSGSSARDAKYSVGGGGDSQGALRNPRADCRADRIAAAGAGGAAVAELSRDWRRGRQRRQ